MDKVNSNVRDIQQQELAQKRSHAFLSSWSMNSSKSQSLAVKRQRPQDFLTSSLAVPPGSNVNPVITETDKSPTSNPFGKDLCTTPGVPWLDTYSPGPLVTHPAAGPPLIDWRMSPTYPRVRDQNEFGWTGACWAFSTVSVLEILYSRRYQKRTHFSYQQLIDCCPKTLGTFAGSVPAGLHYLVSDGVTLEDSYPFVGKYTPCRSDIDIVAKAKTVKQIKNNDEAIVRALARSPLAASIHFPNEILNYKEGVADPAGCRNDERTCIHAVTIVGHGEEYWIIRNTFGEAFGDSGHYLLKKGTCGVGHRVWSATLDDPTQDHSYISKMKKMYQSGIPGITKKFRFLKKAGICP